MITTKYGVEISQNLLENFVFATGLQHTISSLNDLKFWILEKVLRMKLLLPTDEEKQVFATKWHKDKNEVNNKLKNIKCFKCGKNGHYQV